MARDSIRWHGIASDHIGWHWDSIGWHWDSIGWHEMAWYCIGWHRMVWYHIGWHGVAQMESDGMALDSRDGMVLHRMALDGTSGMG